MDANELFSDAASAYAEVIIPLALPKNYTWHIPVEMMEEIVVGGRVEVGLGKNKKYSGIVKSIHYDKPTAFEPKSIISVLDTVPIVFDQQLKLWSWIADYYMCSEGEVMQAALPTHFKLSGEASEDMKDNYIEKKESYVILNTEYNKEENLAKLLNEDKKLQRAEKQMELLLAYLHFVRVDGEVTQSQLLKKANASIAQLKGLTEKNILRIEKRSVDRIQNLPKNVTIDFELSTAQTASFEKVKQVFASKQVCLLHGVTSSGKTQIYIRLMEQMIKEGKQVLYMLPEIALTAQIIRRLQKHFGGYITVYHSKFNQNERIEIWNKVKMGEARIIVGARSSLFLPFQELGLVICDEEHDQSYKQQEPAPRYNARDGAIYFASLFHSNVLLGSATPSVESYYNAQGGKYGLVELKERYGAVAMPQIEIIDTKKIPKPEHSKVIISPVLRQTIQEVVERDKQVILFQNRRGYSPYQVCQTCGWIPHCKQCDVSLTFHKTNHRLQCHYCGATYSTVHTCEACGNHTFIQQNFGTERIEEELVTEFPGAKVARMDIDTVKGKNAHDALIRQFEQGKVDILVGTQMVSKGLDFDNVELVGILDGDAILSFADFRVNERAFQLMEQVSGRAGRKEKQGLVLIQVRNTNHPLLPLIQQHDYHQFFIEEMENRKRFFYPPFSRIILITFKHKDVRVVSDAAMVFAEQMKAQYGNYMIGPAQPVVNRVRNQYLMELLFKLPKDSSTIHQCKQSILQNIAILHQDKRCRSVQVIPDVDAV